MRFLVPDSCVAPTSNPVRLAESSIFQWSMGQMLESRNHLFFDGPAGFAGRWAQGPSARSQGPRPIGQVPGPRAHRPLGAHGPRPIGPWAWADQFLINLESFWDHWKAGLSGGLRPPEPPVIFWAGSKAGLSGGLRPPDPLVRLERPTADASAFQNKP